MPKTLSQWITLVALTIGIFAAAIDARPLAAFAFLVTIVFGLAASRVAKSADRYRL